MQKPRMSLISMSTVVTVVMVMAGCGGGDDGDSDAGGSDATVVALSEELTTTCDSFDGAMTVANGEGYWSCEVVLGETLDPYETVVQAFLPLCPAPSQFTSALLTDAAPYSAEYSCAPAESFVSSELVAACASVEGTIQDAYNDTNWTCGDVPLGETTDGYDAVQTLLEPFCPPPAEYTSGLLSADAPWIAGWTCNED